MSNSKDFSKNEGWLQIAIDNEYINYQKYSTFENIKKIGEGAMGEVFKATSHCYGTTVALKKFTRFTINEIINELRQHKTVESHENILKLYGISTLVHPPSLKQNQLMLIIEYADGGTLRQYLHKNFKTMDWGIKLKFVKQIASAIYCLHENKIVHRDLHTENVFIHRNNIKIGDFGLSKRIFEQTNSLLRMFGSVRYSDPKYLKDQEYTRDEKSDVYSVGMIFWEISSGRLPFESDLTDISLVLAIIGGKREIMVEDTPQKYFEIYTACWHNDPNRRPTIKQVIEDLNNVNISDDYMIETNSNLTKQRKSSSGAGDNINSLTLSYCYQLINPEPSNRIQVSKYKNKFIIKNIANIKEKALKNLIEKFVNQLYFKSQSSEVNIFEEFKSDWLKVFIQKLNIDSKKLLEMMLKHNQNNSYFTSYIGYFYQYGIGTEVDENRSFGFYHQATILYSKEKLKSNSLEIINQSIGQCFLAIFYKKGIIVSKDIKIMFEYFNKSAQLGNVFAQLNIAHCYLKGYGIDKNEQKAFEWLKKSAGNGNNIAQYWIAVCYNEDISTEENTYQAFRWFLKAAENGNINAQYKVAMCYNDGIGTEKNEQNSFKWFLKSAKHNNNNAQYCVAKCYRNGIGTEKNELKAFEWFLKSALNQNSSAQYWVAKCHQDGIGTEKNEQEVLEWLKKSAENNNNKAQCLVAKYYRDNICIEENEQKSFEWYLKSAENGNINAQYEVAICYKDGIGTEKNEQNSFKWFLESAKNDNNDAQYEVAMCYKKGEGTEKNDQNALEWFLESAKNENYDAQYKVAICYKDSIGTEKDEQKAFEWFLRAAGSENCDAQFEVAKCYKYGLGTEKDEQKAFEWFLKSAEKANINAQYEVAKCYKYGIGTERNEQKVSEWFL